MSTTFEELVDLAVAGERVLLVGAPGCAKTARVHAVAAHPSVNRRVIVMRLAMSERVDFAGAMVPDTEAGVTRALPLDLFNELQSTQEPILLFVDDMGQAPMDVQSALMKWFDEGVLSPTVLIWGATNRTSDKAGVRTPHEALRSRFGPKFEIPTQVEVRPGVWEPLREDSSGAPMLGTWEDEVAGWCEWAMDFGAPAEVIAWHRATNGRTLYQWKPSSNAALSMPDYRAWERVISLWNKGLRSLRVLSSVIGKPVAGEFLQFAALANELPTPDLVWMDPKGAPIPASPQAKYLICSMLASAVTPEFAEAAVTYMTRLSGEDRVYGVMLALDLRKKLGAKLVGNKAWNKWFLANKELFEAA